MKKNLFHRLKDGDFGLAKTYWGFYVLVSVVYILVLEIIFANTYESYGYAIDTIAAPYFLFVLYGAWNATKKYPGPQHWKILGKLAVILGFAGEIYFLGVNLLGVLG